MGRCVFRSRALALVGLMLAAAAKGDDVLVLEVKASSVGVEEGGLGVFLSGDSAVVKEGTVLTRYGQRNAKAVDLVGTIEEFYSVSDPLRAGWVRTGKPWDKGVPGLVEGGLEAEEPIGHLINDGAALHFDNSTTPAALKKLVVDYSGSSSARANVRVWEGGVWEVAATRDIQPGEELFRSYGASYWLFSNSQRSSDPVVRTLSFLGLSDISPGMLPAGGLVFNQEGRAILSTTLQEPSEEYCGAFLHNFLKLTEPGHLEEQGLTWHGSYKNVLDQMIDKVLGASRPLTEEEEVEEALTKWGEEKELHDEQEEHAEADEIEEHTEAEQCDAP